MKIRADIEVLIMLIHTRYGKKYGRNGMQQLTELGKICGMTFSMDMTML